MYFDLKKKVKKEDIRIQTLDLKKVKKKKQDIWMQTLRPCAGVQREERPPTVSQGEGLQKKPDPLAPNVRLLSYQKLIYAVQATQFVEFFFFWTSPSNKECIVKIQNC